MKKAADQADSVVEDSSQAEIAYSGLRKLVRAGHYPPGHVLSEVAVGEQLGVGRTPIREAVSRLAHEGLLIRMPKRGVVVATLSAKDVHELYEVRAALETLCARRAATELRDDELQDLRELVNAAEAKVDAGMTWREYREEDARFHRRLWEAGDNQRAMDTLSSMHDAAVLDPWFAQISDMPGQSKRSITQHRAIIAALATHDPDQVERAIRNHTESYQHQLAIRLFGSASRAGGVK